MRVSTGEALPAPAGGRRQCLEVSVATPLSTILPASPGALFLIVLLLTAGAPALGTPRAASGLDRDALTRQAKELVKQDKHEQALEVYSRLLRTHPRDTDLHRKYQNCLMTLDRGREARQRYRYRLRKDPTPQNWYLLGRILEEPDDAQAHFEEAIRLDSTYAWGYYGLARRLEEKQEFRPAAQLIRRALDLGLQEENAWYWAGWCYEKLGLNRHAVAAYRRYLAESDGDDALYVGHKIEILQGDFSTVLAHILVALGPVLGWFWYIRRKKTMGSISWPNSLMLVVAGAVFSAYLLTDWLYEEVYAAGVTELMYQHPLPQRLARHFLVVGPLEEFSKWVFVVLLAYVTRFIRNPLDGLICGASVAIGFAWAENVHYMFYEGWPLAITRGVICVPIHMICSGLWGYGLGLVRVTANKKRAWLGMGLSLMAGAFFHGLYNASNELKRWQEASEITLYAGLATPLAVYVLARVFRRHVRLARLWTAYHRRSASLRRQVADLLDERTVLEALGVRRGSAKARRQWSACVNVVTQRALERLAKTLEGEAAQRVENLLAKPEVKSREVHDLLREVASIDEVVEQECRQFEAQVGATGGPWRQRWRRRQLRRRVAWELQVEAMPAGPVRMYADAG